jgi:Protein of unknown function (DUF1353)
MANWNPGPNPFPAGKIKKISHFEYLDELRFLYHAKIHVKKVPKTHWQLTADFRVRMTLHPSEGSPAALTITVPRGMHTDLASVPESLWSIVGPIGPHLEASIVHDYLYMAWTDFHGKARQDDWDFADEVFLAGMKASKVPKRNIIYSAVRFFGWPIFKSKNQTLAERMDEWLAALDSGHGRGERNPSHAPPSQEA